MSFSFVRVPRRAQPARVFQPKSFVRLSMIVSRVTARGIRFFGATAIVAVLSGCQSYRPEPLDLPSHVQQWRTLSPAGEEVRAFADEMARRRPDRAATFDPTDGLSLAEGEIVAMMFNPDLRIARSRVGMFEATAEHAGRWSDPTFQLDALKIAESIPNPWILSSSLSFTIPISGRLRAEKAMADAGVAVELGQVAEAEWRTRRSLRDAWVSWSAEQIKLEQTQAILRELDAIVETATKLVKAGELPAAEASLFSIERATRQTDRERLAAAFAERAQGIKSLLGLAPRARVDLLPSLAAAQPDLTMESPGDRNPTLARLEDEYELAERVLVTEIRRQYPDLTLGPQFERDEGQSRIGFLGAIPVPILISNKQGIAEARAAREVARAAFETEYQRLSGRLAGLRARLDGIHSRRETMEQTLVPLVDRQVRDAYRLLELGEGSSLVLLESLVRAYEVKLQLVDLHLEEARVKNEIQFLLGPEFPLDGPGTVSATP